MGKKILAIISDHPKKTTYYKKQIEAIFQDKIIIKELIVTKNTTPKDLDLNFNVGLICASKIYNRLKSWVKGDVPLIMFKRTVSKSALEMLSKIPNGSNIAIYGTDLEMESVIITRLYTLGLTNINFFPYKLIKNSISKMDAVVVLDDESNGNNVNLKHDKLIFAGHSLLEVSTIVDLALLLDLEDHVFTQDITKSFKELATVDFGFVQTIKKTKFYESHLNILLDMVNKGVLAVDQSGLIKIFNEEARELLQFDILNILNSNAFELFPFIPFKEAIEKNQKINDIIVPYNDNHLIVSVAPIIHSGSIYGATATIKKYTDAEKEQNKIRAIIMGKGHVAKHTFSNIVSVSKEMEKCIKIAKIMAQSDSSILITGETGTGKELFAQSIHNYSPRKNEPFVAFNCGALPEGLLESELFGYEEGAFTGARKGGKQGLFEIAHKGTIFLDEISEMPPYLQLKLLRVLQEREIMRIGGDRIIKIDIRIIAATNKDLREEVEKNRFRKDLYYRLNVLPLYIPPLRERKDDILPLIEYFKEKFNASFTLTKAAEKVLLNHGWTGNIRELINLVEYLGCLNFDVVDVGDLPITFRRKKEQAKIEDYRLKNFLYTVNQKDYEKYIFILSELEKAYKYNIGLGRRTLYKNAIDEGLAISEYEIRKILSNLESYSMVDIGKGRSGSRITELGLEALSFLKENGGARLF